MQFIRIKTTNQLKLHLLKLSAPSSFEDQKRPAFPDLSRSNWAYEALSRAYREGWLQRFSDESIRPDAWVHILNILKTKR